MAIRAVLFDVGDTLWHGAAAPAPAFFRAAAAERAAAFLAGQNLPTEQAGELARSAWEGLEVAMRTARATDRVEPDYGRVAFEAARQLGIELEAAAGAAFMEAIYVSGAEGGKAAYPDARETLDELIRRGFRLGIVTNRAFGGERFRADLAAAALDVAWESVAVSVEVGYLKPHPAIFERALREMRLDPREAVMVGNSLLEDIAGAQALGMKAAWKRSKPDADGVTPDFTFDEVSELLTWDLLEKGCNDG